VIGITGVSSSDKPTAATFGAKALFGAEPGLVVFTVQAPPAPEVDVLQPGGIPAPVSKLWVKLMTGLPTIKKKLGVTGPTTPKLLLIVTGTCSRVPLAVAGGTT